MALHAALRVAGTAPVTAMQQRFQEGTDLLRHFDLDLGVVGVGVQHDD